jgi:hypothetical protein
MDSFKTVQKNARLAQKLSSSDINRRLSEDDLLGRIEAVTDFRRPNERNYLRLLASLASVAAVVVAVMALSGSFPSTNDRGHNVALSVRCFSTASLNSSSEVMPMRQTHTLGCNWHLSQDAVSSVRSISCVLNDGQVGVFPSRRRGATCATVGLPPFTPTSVPQLDAMLVQLAKINSRTRCNHPDVLVAKAGIVLGRFGVANWRIRNASSDVCSIVVIDKEKRQITVEVRH